MTWTVIPDVDVEAGGIPKGSTITAIRDNIIEAQGALKPIAEATISSDATVDFTAFNNTRYRAYRFLIEDIVIGTDNVDFEMLMSTDGGSTFQSSYSGNALGAGGGGVTSGGGGGSQIRLYNGARIFSGTQYPITGQVDIIGAGDATSRTFITSALIANENNSISLSPKSQWTNAFSNTTSDTDAVRFQLSSGTMTSGTIKMYGVIDLLETA